MRTLDDLVPQRSREPGCFTRQEPLGAYLARADYASSSTLRRFARGIAPAESGYLDDGSQRLPQALHAALLEPQRFENDYFVLDGAGVSEFDDETDLLNRIWLSSSEHASLEAMRDAIRAFPRAPLAEWLDTGMRELSIYWSDSAGGRWKARPDCFTGEVVLELKTTQDIRPEAFARTRRRFGYDLQAAQYVDAVGRITGRAPRFAFITIERDAPHYVWLHELAPSDLMRARATLDDLRERYLGREPVS